VLSFRSVVAVLIISGSASTAFAAMVGTNGPVAIHSGPGAEYPIVGNLPAGVFFDVTKCNKWCQVVWGEGHAYAMVGEITGAASPSAHALSMPPREPETLAPQPRVAPRAPAAYSNPAIRDQATVPRLDFDDYGSEPASRRAMASHPTPGGVYGDPQGFEDDDGSIRTEPELRNRHPYPDGYPLYRDSDRW